MRYNLIIVACSSSKELIRMTEECIVSALRDAVDLEITVVETYKHYPYNANVLMYSGDFNYNRALNLGISLSRECDIYILANNDIKFYPGWSAIGQSMYDSGFGSASALSNKHRGIEPGNYIYAGYNIGVFLAGWCIFATSQTIKTIGKLDETYDFWCSDNVYADQLKLAGIRHGLFCSIRVDHVENATLKTVPMRTRKNYTLHSLNKYQYNGS